MPSKRKLASSTRPNGRSNGVQKNRKPAPTKALRSSLASVAASSTPTQTSSKPSIPTQELSTRPQTRAQKRKRIDEDNQPQERRRTDPPSVPAPAAVSQEPVGTSQTPEHERGQKRPRKDRQSSSIAAAAALDLVTVHEPPANKRLRNAQDKPPHEQRQQSETGSLLSEANLRKLQSQLKQPEEMEPAATPADRVRKRETAMRQNSFSDPNTETATASVRSQKSAGSLKFYRYNVLRQARVYIRCEYPPLEIQAMLDVIFKREVSGERRVEISRIAKETARNFSSKTQGASREDDLLELLNSAFDKLFPDGMFNCPRKADWNPDLKPNILQDGVWNLDALDPANDETDDVVERPPKRQQADQSFPSPTISQPPAAPSQSKQDGAVKSPRPDSTIGYQHSTITNALIATGLSELKADDLLRALQLQGKLFSDPTMDYLDVRFPIQVVEGKAYATGKPMFEAENQAVVSGACMVNLQQQLIDLYKGLFPDAEQSRTPFAFSVCTEGPVIQYWVNYFLIEEGIRMHYMNLLCICNGALYDTLEVLLVKWEQLMGWYKDVFLKDVSEKLHRIAKHIARP